MATTLQTPGVYINEINAFPNSVVPVSTSVVAFIGYTERAAFEGRSYVNKPVSIYSLADYEAMFGKGPGAANLFSITAATTDAVATVLQPVIDLGAAKYRVGLQSPAYRFYDSLRLFFANGGGQCTVISVGDYTKPPSAVDLSAGLQLLENETEPAILVIPDAVALQTEAYAAFTQQVLMHCDKMQNRVAILDIYDGAVSDPALVEPVIAQFRNATGTVGLSYGAAYFPWLVTGIVARAEISFLNFPDSIADLLEKNESVTKALEPLPALRKAFAQNVVDITIINKIQDADKLLLTASKNYYAIVSAALDIVNVLPPSGAMAGVYVLQDNLVSVSRAPANITLVSVLSPTVNLTDHAQMALNVDAITGKSINAIRAFPMKGVMPWGARTLDGNSQDFRYINVRRTLIYIEQSVKVLANQFVFSPNTANTWVLIKSMTDNFLCNCWTAGMLAGSKPEDAYQVTVGLGQTMTADDILNGYMNLSIKVAVSHPSEFIVITLSQQMQIS